MSTSMSETAAFSKDTYPTSQSMDDVLSDGSSMATLDSESVSSPGNDCSSSNSSLHSSNKRSDQSEVRSCPWKVQQSPVSETSFADVMSLDLAKDLQEKEDSFLARLTDNTSNNDGLELSLDSCNDTSNDLLLAQYLQYEYDKQFDSQLRREEQQFNGNSKVSVSFSKFKACPLWYGEDSEDDDQQGIDDENRILDSFEERQRQDPVIGSRGYTRHGDRMVTKHDPQIAGRKNAERIMNLPPGINTGDGGGFHMNISNKVYNKFHRSAMNDIRRKQRFHDKEEKATTDLALDPKTKLLLFKMVNNEVLEEIHGTISTGKESVILHANGGRYEDLELPSECVIKIFKTTLTDFKTRGKYIKDDYRFKDRMSQSNSRTLIKWWCEKEYHNLRRLQRADIPSPKPVLIKKHLLVMSFIGKDHQAAPKLKDVQLSYAEWCIAYEEVVEVMVKMYKACRLVHADLSEYNILWYDDHCWFIDLGQAVEPTHCNALEFLYRDCCNITRFFQSKKLTNLMKPTELFQKISDVSITGPEEDAINKIKEYEICQERWNESIKKDTSDQFEFLWKEIQASEKKHQQKYGKEIDDSDTQFTPEFICKDSDQEGNLATSMSNLAVRSQDEETLHENNTTSSSKKKSVKFKASKEPSDDIPTEVITPEEQAIYDKIVEAKKKIASGQSKSKKGKKKKGGSVSN